MYFHIFAIEQSDYRKIVMILAIVEKFMTMVLVFRLLLVLRADWTE
jgi:hypothetical protein